MYELRYDEETCLNCRTVDCLVKCRYMDYSLEDARREKLKILKGEDTKVLTDCVTCYSCEEYCPNGNHPFYQIVDRQEQKGILPMPAPLTKQQIRMMAPKGRIEPQAVQAPLLNMCYFPMLVGNIRGRLFEDASTMVGSDVFCNIMWLHLAGNSVIRERLPRVIDNIYQYYLKDSGVEEIVHFHDECYGAYTQLAPAFGIDVPFRSVHLFEFLTLRLDELRDHVKPLGFKVAYQRPCSSRLSPETLHFVDDLFERIGVTRVQRRYDGDDALCCGAVVRGMQREDEADDLQKRNIDDMVEAGAQICVFNCPMCMFTLGEAVAERGVMPMLMSDLCRSALGES